MVGDIVPVPPAGMRTVTFRWKVTTDKDSGKKLPALSPKRWVIIPQLMSDVEQSDVTGMYLRNLVWDAQREHIFQLLTEGYQDRKPITELTDDDISIDAMAIAAQKTSRGQGKMSRELLEQWFKSEMEENLTGYITEQKGGKEIASITEVETVVGRYRNYYLDMAKTTHIVGVKVAQKLLDMLAFCEDENGREYQFLKGKLTEMSVEKTPEMLGL